MRTAQKLPVALLYSLLLATPVQAQDRVVEYIHTDALGSVVAVTDENRNVIERREYEPYGRQLTPAVQDGPGYTGHVQDAATGLVYMQQRYYDPYIGRMLSVDPVTAYGGGNWRQFNRYAYAFNNPYRFTDPDGRIPIDTIWDIGNVIYDLGKAGVGAATGNSAMVAEGLADAALDAGAMLIPYVPAGTQKLGRMAVKEGIEAASDAGKAGRRAPTASQREAALQRSKGADGKERCTYCGTQLNRKSGKPSSAEIDHRKPYSRGGKTEDTNLDAACRTCNRSKGAKKLGKEWVPPKDRQRLP